MGSDILDTYKFNRSGNFRSLFPNNDDHLEERHFSKIHKIILGIISGDLEDELNNPVSNLDEPNSAGNTALIWAVRRNDHAAVGRLINGKSDITICNKLGFSALSYASRLSGSKCLKLLIDSGAKTT